MPTSEYILALSIRALNDLEETDVNHRSELNAIVLRAWHLGVFDEPVTDAHYLLERFRHHGLMAGRFTSVWWLSDRWWQWPWLQRLAVELQRGTDGEIRPRQAGSPPDFITVANEPSTNPERLRQFLKLPHGAMNNVLLREEDIDKIVKYILEQKSS